MSTNNQQPPAERAAELVDKLPSSPNLITKTGSVVLGTGLLATAISQELYVVNEETVIAAGFFVLLTFIAKVSAPWCYLANWGVTTRLAEHPGAVPRLGGGSHQPYQGYPQLIPRRAHASC